MTVLVTASVLLVLAVALYFEELKDLYTVLHDNRYNCFSLWAE